MEILNYLGEIWKDIKGFEGKYQVSNFGRVKNLTNGRIRKLGKTTSGYYQIHLFKNGVCKVYLVHRLVYETFIGEIPEGMQVNHINEDKLDNRLSNLNLMSPKENIHWGTGIERCVRAKINGKKSKPVLQYDTNNILINTYPSVNEAQRQTGYYEGNIAKCCNGKRKTCGGYIWMYK